jgi:hypothetical protein
MFANITVAAYARSLEYVRKRPYARTVTDLIAVDKSKRMRKELCFYRSFFGQG